jgi:NADP-dependent 3-hydroxy acid dehydrogenase YdfG
LLLTQSLWSFLIAARGRVVFINLRPAFRVKTAYLGQYGATKHALRAIADSLRVEVNPKRIRVMSLFLGRTATPMQEAMTRWERRKYRSDLLLQPEDVASAVVHCLPLPRTAEVTDISMRPMLKTGYGAQS